MIRKILRKSQPNFQDYVKKIEALAKKLFSYKKNVQNMLKISLLFKKFINFTGK